MLVTYCRTLACEHRPGLPLYRFVLDDSFKLRLTPLEGLLYQYSPRVILILFFILLFLRHLLLNINIDLVLFSLVFYIWFIVISFIASVVFSYDFWILSIIDRFIIFKVDVRGARWLSGRVSDSGARGRGFETYRRRVVSLSKTLYSPKVLVNYPGSDGSVPT